MDRLSWPTVQKLVGIQAKAVAQIDKRLIAESEKAAENARKLQEAQKKATAEAKALAA